MLYCWQNRGMGRVRSLYPTKTSLTELPLRLAKRTGGEKFFARRQMGRFDRMIRIERIGRIAPLGVKARGRSP
jgi:hypothetical protein